MKIMLLRHGKPRNAEKSWMSAAEFGQWVLEYDNAGIDGTSLPLPDACEQARRCSVVVCSHLTRSLESASVLGVASIERQDAAFRELEMPYARWTFPKLPPTGWSFLFRGLWLCGYSPHAESLAHARARAQTCAETLVRLAHECGSVLCVGHGLLNWQMAKHLLTLGWRGPKRIRQSYWDYGVYRAPTF